MSGTIMIEITYFISLLEKNLNKAKIKYMPLPPGDVIATDSDNKACKNGLIINLKH